MMLFFVRLFVGKFFVGLMVDECDVVDVGFIGWVMDVWS